MWYETWWSSNKTNIWNENIIEGWHLCMCQGVMDNLTRHDLRGDVISTKVIKLIKLSCVSQHANTRVYTTNRTVMARSANIWSRFICSWIQMIKTVFNFHITLTSTMFKSDLLTSTLFSLLLLKVSIHYWSTVILLNLFWSWASLNITYMLHSKISFFFLNLSYIFPIIISCSRWYK